eukprot:7352260-Alexandrium_andersonii.AAC.1
MAQLRALTICRAGRAYPARADQRGWMHRRSMAASRMGTPQAQVAFLSRHYTSERVAGTMSGEHA